ncbi:MAG: adenylate/guanylate cyclase domain-containing protein [Alphaproteobacteria bacterium]
MRTLPPEQEAKRLEALAQYHVLDTPPEFAQDALTELAAEICHCPVALISLVDDHRQWFKAKYGLPADFTECPREVSVCSSTVCSNDLLYVPDLTQDARFKDLPIVVGEPHIRFYCGMPLINRDGYAVGTLCVVDFKAHELTPAQRESVRRLAQQAMAQLELRRGLFERDALLEQLSEAKRAAERERERSEKLLRTVMPEAIASELMTSGRVQSRYHEAATILFADFREFTRLTEGLEPARLVEQLNQHFTRFDEIAAANRTETLKTMGDACLCVAGLTEANRTHPLDACLAGLQFQKVMAEANRQRTMLRLKPWELRVGINTGSLVAGVVGNRRFTFDVWGNAVNVAQRLEHACEPGRVTVSASTYHHVAARFETERRGSVEVKHLGAIDMYVLVRIKPEFSADAVGTQPNDAFWK